MVVDHNVGINSNIAIVLAIIMSVLTLFDYSGMPSFDLLEPSEEDPVENNVESINNISIHKFVIDIGLSIVDETVITIASICENYAEVFALENPFLITLAVNSTETVAAIPLLASHCEERFLSVDDSVLE